MTADDLIQLSDEGFLLMPVDPRDHRAIETMMRGLRGLRLGDEKVEELLEKLKEVRNASDKKRL